LKINFFEKLLGSGFYSGYSPFISGTIGSLVAIGFFMIPGFEQLYIIIPAIVIFFVYGVFVGDKFENQYGKDPAECTIDEFVGTWISLIALPKTIWILTAAFILWRILDIIKPPPARNLEKIKGGLGIMLDDVISGVYTLIIVHLAVYLLGSF